MVWGRVIETKIKDQQLDKSGQKDVSQVQVHGQSQDSTEPE